MLSGRIVRLNLKHLNFFKIILKKKEKKKRALVDHVEANWILLDVAERQYL